MLYFIEAISSYGKLIIMKILRYPWNLSKRTFKEGIEIEAQGISWGLMTGWWEPVAPGWASDSEYQDL